MWVRTFKVVTLSFPMQERIRSHCECSMSLVLYSVVSRYQRIHKRHHEWKAPVAMVSIYCHPIEHLVSNVRECRLGLDIYAQFAQTSEGVLIVCTRISVRCSIIFHSTQRSRMHWLYSSRCCVQYRNISLSVIANWDNCTQIMCIIAIYCKTCFV